MPDLAILDIVTVATSKYQEERHFATVLGFGTLYDEKCALIQYHHNSCSSQMIGLQYMELYVTGKIRMREAIIEEAKKQIEKLETRLSKQIEKTIQLDSALSDKDQKIAELEQEVIDWEKRVGEWTP